MQDRRDFIEWAAVAGAATLLTAGAASAAPAAAAHARTFRGTLRQPVRYLVWMPEPAARPAAGWPLLLFLHGSGERGADLAKVKAHGPPKHAAAGRRFPFILVAPQLPEGQRWAPDALDALLNDLIARLPVDPDRVMLTGMSLGGHGAWDYAVAHADRLAALAPVCGVGNPGEAAALAKLPIWAIHGALDDVVPLAGDRAMVESVRAAGGQVKFTVYADVGHNAWDRAYADPALYAWLLAQRRSQPARD